MGGMGVGGREGGRGVGARMDMHGCRLVFFVVVPAPCLMHPQFYPLHGQVAGISHDQAL